jgi:co-chaperonin GroES (HSP10)
MDFNIRPIRKHVILLDDQPSDYVDADGVLVDSSLGTNHLDFYVVGVGTEEHVDFGKGDRVVLADENVGRKVRLDGVVYRVVRTADVIAVVGRGE